MRQNSLFNNSSLALLCLGLLVCTAFVSGCSKPKNEAPEEKKNVVTEMNIQTSDADSPPPKDSEVESLPFDADATKEEELPVLGSVGSVGSVG